MNKKEKTTTPSVSSTTTDPASKPIPDKPHQDKLRAVEDTADKTDRPGFDLAGASEHTDAGTGLGLGVDAADTPGERQLPGRRFENGLTIPRWSGPEPEDASAPDKKPAGPDTKSSTKAKTVN